VNEAPKVTELLEVSEGTEMFEHSTQSHALCDILRQTLREKAGAVCEPMFITVKLQLGLVPAQGFCVIDALVIVRSGQALRTVMTCEKQVLLLVRLLSETGVP
jgi:hypothetical protein